MSMGIADGIAHLYDFIVTALCEFPVRRLKCDGDVSTSRQIKAGNVHFDGRSTINLLISDRGRRRIKLNGVEN